MKKRTKRTNTGLFFDSLKHFKNNISNLVTIEFLTLYESKNLKEYSNMKPVNYKSKLPDLKKIGLIHYNKPSENIYSLTEEGLNIYKVLNNYISEYKYPEDQSKRIRTVKPEEILDLLTEKEYEIFQYNMRKLLLSYFDTADFIRPYLLLIKIIEKNNITKLNNETLYNILAQSKLNILNSYIDPNAFINLDEDVKNELYRPTSYIRNFLQTANIIDSKNNIIYEKNKIDSIILELDQVDLSQYIHLEDRKIKKRTSRSTQQQREFREEVLNNFNNKCAISGDPIIIKRDSREDIIVLEAAHIIPYSEGGSFSYSNGISLTPELHKLFDLELFTFKYIDDDTLVVITTDNKDVKDNGILNEIKGTKIYRKKLKKGMPDNIAINYREKCII